MILHHAKLAYVNSVFKAKLVCYFTLRALAETHVCQVKMWLSEKGSFLTLINYNEQISDIVLKQLLDVF